MMLSLLPLTFVTIVEQGSITQAAESLKLAKSAVSQNLKRLETQLGIKLFVRTTRRMTLTAAGERYYKRCKEILALAQLAQLASNELEVFGSYPSGPVNITAPHALIRPLLAPVIAELSQIYPDVIPSLIADDQRLNIVAAGIDVAITVGALPDSGLRAKRVGQLRDILCASPQLLARRRRTLDESELHWVQALPYIAHNREALMTEYQVNCEGVSQTLQFKATCRANTIESQISLVREGVGIALLPNIAVADELTSTELIQLLPQYESKSMPIYAVHGYDTQPPLAVKAVIEIVENQFQRLWNR
ncbi:LysR family transcriptional regulator [uncultured Shewanella sp.]|uniref:LysR family transcriptional regulator n=1 Tax=uncultured Shewanella sp. TaxID=173975 RepID=UPI00262BFC66|nr:LysR family transcriptional regulator [uncultured Shewanella sp.]